MYALTASPAAGPPRIQQQHSHHPMFQVMSSSRIPHTRCRHCSQDSRHMVILPRLPVSLAEKPYLSSVASLEQSRIPWAPNGPPSANRCPSCRSLI
eukprot:1606998-Amphidinium_carterae.1